MKGQRVKKLTADGVEITSDGEAVDAYDGKFTGVFMMENWDAAPISNGDPVMFLVSARTENPIFKHVKKTGELKRTNPFRVEEAILVDKDIARTMLDAAIAAQAKVPVIESAVEQEVDEADVSMFDLATFENEYGAS